MKFIALYVQNSKLDDLEIAQSNRLAAYNKLDIDELKIEQNFNVENSKIELEKISLEYIMLGELVARTEMFIIENYLE
jgi:hypothetical protein